MNQRRYSIEKVCGIKLEKTDSGKDRFYRWPLNYFVLVKIVKQLGLLWVSDCKISSRETRGHIHHEQDYYLTPLSRVGQVFKLINQWVGQALGELILGQEINRINSEGKSTRIATAYELSRSQQIYTSHIRNHKAVRPRVVVRRKVRWFGSPQLTPSSWRFNILSRLTWPSTCPFRPL